MHKNAEKPQNEILYQKTEKSIDKKNPNITKLSKTKLALSTTDFKFKLIDTEEWQGTQTRPASKVIKDITKVLEGTFKVVFDKNLDKAQKIEFTAKSRFSVDRLDTANTQILACFDIFTAEIQSGNSILLNYKEIQFQKLSADDKKAISQIPKFYMKIAFDKIQNLDPAHEILEP